MNAVDDFMEKYGKKVEEIGASILEYKMKGLEPLDALHFTAKKVFPNLTEEDHGNIIAFAATFSAFIYRG